MANNMAGNIVGNLANVVGNMGNNVPDNIARQAQLTAHQHAQLAAAQQAHQNAQVLHAANQIHVAPPHQAPPAGRAPFFWPNHGGHNAGAGMPPQMLPANLHHFMSTAMAAAAAAAPDKEPAVVASTKLSVAKGNAKSNSSLVLRNSIQKVHKVYGNLITVAQWTRKCVEENLDWLIKLARRHHEDANVILLSFGDGCETLVLMDEKTNEIPSDFSAIPTVAIGVSLVDSKFKGSEESLAQKGVLQPTDSIWEHVRFDQANRDNNDDAKCLYLHTCIDVWNNGLNMARRVVLVNTGGPDEPFLAKNYIANPRLVERILEAWKASNVLNPVATTAKQQSDGKRAETETEITFNSRELVLLEKAYDETLTARDLKLDVRKIGKADKAKAQKVIQRARKELVEGTKEEEVKQKKVKAAAAAAKPKSKKVEKPEDESGKEEEEEKPKTKAKSSKVSTKKVEKPEDEDDDDEEKPKTKAKSSRASTKKAEKPEDDEEEEKPKTKAKSSKVSTPKSKAAAKSPAANKSKASDETKKSSPAKTPEPKKRGRPKGAKNKQKPETRPTKRTRK